MLSSDQRPLAQSDRPKLVQAGTGGAEQPHADTGGAGASRSELERVGAGLADPDRVATFSAGSTWTGSGRPDRYWLGQLDANE